MSPKPEASPSVDQLEPDPDPRADRVMAAVSQWTSQLVDLGGRNTLLWFRELPTGTLDLTLAHPGGLAKLLAGRATRLSDLFREPAALDEARRRARAIAAKTREMREERGIATGFIAIGMATWAFPGKREPAAPVLLRRCTLKPTSLADDDYALDVDPHVELNPVLIEYLASQCRLSVDADAIEDAATHEPGFDPYPAFDALRTVCATVPGFTVTSRLIVGNFSYAKLPMVADLADQGADLANHDVIAALAGDPDALRSVRGAVPERLLGAGDPRREHLILDADHSQVGAIDAVRAGGHLVIQGPPGTGKSQTIANLVASLAADGKTVLFVAEKRAAIDAVLGRLRRAGLDDLALDLYDGAGSRRRLAQQFGAGLDRLLATPDVMADPTAATIEADLIARRNELLAHTEALHDRREPWGVSAYEAQEAISALTQQPDPARSRIRLRDPDLHAIDHDDLRIAADDLTKVAALGAWSHDDVADPWFGARIGTADEAVRARDIVTRLAEGGLDAVGTTMAEVFAEVRLPPARTVDDWGSTLSTVLALRDTLEIFNPRVFDIPLRDYVDATGDADYRRQHGVDLGFFARWGLRRQARRLLRPGPRPDSLHEALLAADHQRTAWYRLVGAGGRPEVPVEIERARAAYDSLAEDLSWLEDRLAPTPDGGDLTTTPLPELRTQLATLAARPERLAVIPSVIGPLDTLRGAGWGQLIDDLAARRVPAEQVRSEMEFVWWASVSDEIALRDPLYGAHNGDHLRAVAEQYAAADLRYQELTSERVRTDVAARLRQVLGEYPHHESLVRAEASRARRHRPLRDLLPVVGTTLTAVKPCWAMSPLVVASVLPPGTWFDVVIFDEASQVPPAQAISAISRAQQVVVVGDRRQLPPTTFFTAVTDDPEPFDDGSLTTGFESVLDVLSATLPTRSLRWHYRSRDERLIAFANDHIYDGKLVTFPGTATDPVLAFERVDGRGILDEGAVAVETTTAEVDRVVELVIDHARSRPHESLGVIALGIKHAARIDDALRRALADTEGLDEFFDEERIEPFFVKNLERVQGDERDAIILSIGYGKTPHGRVMHRFGPLNIAGGERRLNVAITRAKCRMTVVSALVADDLDPSRLRAAGAIMLRDFLAYAEEQAGWFGEMPRPAQADPSTNGVVLREFADRLRRAGLVVHEGLGASAQPIDLAVESGVEQGRLAVAVESDGKQYAAMAAVRDRDRLRAEHLTRLGWTHLRVWSEDLFRDPARDLSRVVAAANRLPTDRGVGHIGAEPSEALPTDQSAGTLSESAEPNDEEP